MNRSGGSSPTDYPNTTPGPGVAGELLDRARAAKNDGMTDGGMRYGPQTDKALAELDSLSASMMSFDPLRHLAKRSDAIAFWINLYNAMVIHGAMSFHVLRRMTEVPRFFTRTVYDVGGQLFNLDAIEHGVLRANRGHPARLAMPQFMPWDRRQALVLRPMDLRIHFALNCGTVSCPPIRHYTPEHLDQELDLAARSFVAGGGVRVDPHGGGVLLSRIFLWYFLDFGWTRRQQLRTVIGFLDQEQRIVVNEAAKKHISYAEYDWSFA